MGEVGGLPLCLGHAGCLAGWVGGGHLASGLAGCLVGRLLASWVAGWLAGQLAGCLAGLTPRMERGGSRSHPGACIQQPRQGLNTPQAGNCMFERVAHFAKNNRCRKLPLSVPSN